MSKHYSYQTEKVYVEWFEQFIFCYRNHSDEKTLIGRLYKVLNDIIRIFQSDRDANKAIRDP